MSAGDMSAGAPPSGYCRHCGKALTPETLREVRGTYYCPDCLAAMVGQAQPPVPAEVPIPLGGLPARVPGQVPAPLPAEVPVPVQPATAASSPQAPQNLVPVIPGAPVPQPGPANGGQFGPLTVATPGAPR